MKRPARDRQRKGELSPLQYMLAVMNDETASKERRDRMAVTLARYLCPRPGDKGKKDHAAEAAKWAGADTEWHTDLQYLDGRLRE